MVEEPRVLFIITGAAIHNSTRCCGKVWPYIKLQTKHQELRTPITTVPGPDATWNASFILQQNELKGLSIVVMDAGLIRDYVVGSATTNFVSDSGEEPIKREIEVMRKSRLSAVVSVSLKRLVRPAEVEWTSAQVSSRTTPSSSSASSSLVDSRQLSLLEEDRLDPSQPMRDSVSFTRLAGAASRVENVCPSEKGDELPRAATIERLSPRNGADEREAESDLSPMRPDAFDQN